MSDEENYYSLLKVSPNATTSEIVSAYHKAKNAFSKNSMATYSLFNENDLKEVLTKLETAYQTLTNADRRRAYDRIVMNAAEESLPVMTELQMKKKVNETYRNPSPAVDSREPVTLTVVPGGTQSESSEPTPQRDESVPSPQLALESLKGDTLSQLRKSRNLTLEEVSQITKISTKYLTALETNDFSNLPARVYVQGFIKNLAKLYQVDPQKAVTQYLQFLDAQSPKT